MSFTAPVPTTLITPASSTPRPTPMNRHERRSQYAVISRSKPHRHIKHSEAKLRGKEKIHRFIARGIVLNTPKRVLGLKPLALGIKKAIFGGVK